MRYLPAVLSYLLLAAAPAQAAMSQFNASVSAYTSAGRLVGERTLLCPGSQACRFLFDIPFEGEVWSMGVHVKQARPGVFNAWVVGEESPIDSWGLPTGYLEFNGPADGIVELEALWSDHRLIGSPVGRQTAVARFEIDVDCGTGCRRPAHPGTDSVGVLRPYKKPSESSASDNTEGTPASSSSITN